MTYEVTERPPNTLILTDDEVSMLMLALPMLRARAISPKYRDLIDNLHERVSVMHDEIAARLFGLAS